MRSATTAHSPSKPPSSPSPTKSQACSLRNLFAHAESTELGARPAELRDDLPAIAGLSGSPLIDAQLFSLLAIYKPEA